MIGECVLTGIVVESALDRPRPLWPGTRVTRRALVIIVWHVVFVERNETGYFDKGDV